MALKQSQAGGVFRRQQRDMDLVAHALSTGLEDLERASVHIQRALKIWKKARLMIGCWRPTMRCIKQPDTRWDMLYAC